MSFGRIMAFSIQGPDMEGERFVARNHPIRNTLQILTKCSVEHLVIMNTKVLFKKKKRVIQGHSVYPTTRKGSKILPPIAHHYYDYPSIRIRFNSKISILLNINLRL